MTGQERNQLRKDKEAIQTTINEMESIEDQLRGWKEEAEEHLGKLFDLCQRIQIGIRSYKEQVKELNHKLSYD